MYEGEVTELSPVETENPVAGYSKTVSHVVIGLKTAKGTKQLKLDPSIYESLQKERVEVGDVIYIEANSGAVKRLGRSDTFATEFDLEAEEYVPLPKVMRVGVLVFLKSLKINLFLRAMFTNERRLSRMLLSMISMLLTPDPREVRTSCP